MLFQVPDICKKVNLKQLALLIVAERIALSQFQIEEVIMDESQTIEAINTDQKSTEELSKSSSTQPRKSSTGTRRETINSPDVEARKSIALSETRKSIAEPIEGTSETGEGNTEARKSIALSETRKSIALSETRNSIASSETRKSIALSETWKSIELTEDGKSYTSNHGSMSTSPDNKTTSTISAGCTDDKTTAISSEEINFIDYSLLSIPINDKKIQAQPPLGEKIDEWLAWDKNDITHDAIKQLMLDQNNEELEELLMGRLEFGTAGLRGPMGAGYTRMNDLVVIQTTQGLCSYLLSTMPAQVTPMSSAETTLIKASVLSTNTWKKTGENSIAIGYDGRYNSKRFAELASTIFLNKGFIVYLFSEMVPTPFVPYCVSYYKCLAGIMITASHNPKDDNGYKLYWNNGAQIIPPHDKRIQLSILDNLMPWDGSWDTETVMKTESLRDPLAEVMAQYYNTLKDNCLDLAMNSQSQINVTYTPMHGVGYRFMKAAFKAANFKDFKPVGLQMFPDPEFPTVKFPNPEEGKSALDLAMGTAEMWNSSIILANDPDADRLAVAEFNELTAAWLILTGNELGTLLGWWTLHVWNTRHKGESRADVYMLGSTVSTKFLQTLAKAEGFNFVETLTGFKWMGNRAYELREAGKTVLFAFEEAIGFMCGTTVLDKDGISAGVYVAEMLAYLARAGMSLAEKLEQLYAEYGRHISNNSYFLCYDPLVLKKLFRRLRHFQDDQPNTYPESILEGKYEISSIRDLTTGYDSSQPDNLAILPISSSSQMITFTFTNGLVTTLRTSGTEPKVKYYTELCAAPDETDVDFLRETLKEMVDAIIQEFLQPDVNKLLTREP